MNELTYATVCSGIECMSVACLGLPMRPVFFSEIEPFPCAVLKAHYPDVPNLGDMSKIRVSQIAGCDFSDGTPSTFKMEITNGTVRIVLDRPIDILAGGTPCQDVSVAGKRAGMSEGSGTRSSLAFDFVRLARELGPRWVLWENVAGSIDSKNAPDFLRFLSALGECGYSLAWRVLDAQYVRVDGMERAVPQRRRRVWVVGCLGADESIPAQILFEPDCVAGHTPPRRRTGQGFAYSLAGRDRVDASMVGEPAARGFRNGSFGQFVNDETCGTLDCGHMNSAANGTPAFAVHSVIALDQGAGKSSVNTTVEHSPTLATTHQGEPCIALDGDKLKPRTDQRKGGNGFGINEDGAGYTLTAVDRHGVAYGINNQGGAAPQFTDEISGTMVAASNSSGNNLHGVAYAADGGEVAATITRQIAEQSGQDNRANAVVECAVSTAYKLDSTASNSMKSANPHSGFHKTEVAACLDTTPPDPTKNQGGNVIVSTNSNGGDVAPTLNTAMAKLGGDNQTTFGGGIVSHGE